MQLLLNYVDGIPSSRLITCSLLWILSAVITVTTFCLLRFQLLCLATGPVWLVKAPTGRETPPSIYSKKFEFIWRNLPIRRWMKFYVDKTWKYKLPKGRRLMTGYMQPSSITCDRLFPLLGFMTGYMQPSARDCWRNGHHLFYAKNFSIPREEVCPCREQLRWSRPV